MSCADKRLTERLERMTGGCKNVNGCIKLFRPQLMSCVDERLTERLERMTRGCKNGNG